MVEHHELNCVLHQNASQYASKRSAISYKTQNNIIIKLYLIENKEVTLLV